MRDEPVRNLVRPVEWITSREPVGYPAAVLAMEQRVERIAQGRAPECVWLLEHPPVYTAGTSANPADLIDAHRFPVHATGRGGQFTYHGPGQRVAYVMLDLKLRGGDVRAFVEQLEAWLIATLATFGVVGCVRPGRIGVWVVREGQDRRTRIREDKVAALGIRVRRGVTFHGVSLNVSPDLTHFDGIVPCGISDHGVTSLKDLGITAAMPDIDAALRAQFAAIFGIGGNTIAIEQSKARQP
jgi:lipoyl(octanoyl) transferase